MWAHGRVPVLLRGLVLAMLLVACADPHKGLVHAEGAPRDPCSELEVYAAEMAPLLAEQAKMETILDRLDHHAAAFPDTDPEVLLAAAQHIWEMVEAHEAALQALDAPAPAAPAVEAHTAWLRDFRCGVERRHTYYECCVARQMNLVYPSEYSDRCEVYDQMAAVFLARAERARTQCAAELAKALAHCDQTPGPDASSAPR